MYNVKKFLNENLKELGIILGNGAETVYSSLKEPPAYPPYTGKDMYIVLILGLVSAAAGSYFLYRKFRKRKSK